MKTIAYRLFLIAKHLSSDALQHRKMLVRYVTLGKIQVEQLPTALYYLALNGSSIIDQEDFEKQVGIGILINFLIKYTNSC
jgi:hypothetical protein